MSTPAPERLLTTRLAAFLLVVAVILAASLAFRIESPDLEGAVELLADGDLDRDERRHMLLRVMELGEADKTLRGRWAATLAAVSLGDRAAFDRFEARLGEGAERVLPDDRRQWLGLGDAALRNVLAAMMTEAAGDAAGARIRWGRVAAQSRLTANVLARSLAAEAELRLQ